MVKGTEASSYEQLSRAEKIEADRQAILNWAADFLERGPKETARNCVISLRHGSLHVVG
jgi:hypothetical protein